MSIQAREKHIWLANLSKIWGGGEKWFLTMGKCLMQEGFQVSWLVYPNSPLEAKLQAQSLPYTSLPLRLANLPVYAHKLQKLFKHKPADIIILNSSQELKTVGWLAKRRKQACVVFRRGVSYPLKDNFLNRFYIQQVADAFLANSQATFKAFSERFPSVLDKPHFTLNNGIDQRAWSSLQATVDPKRLALVARLSPEKGIERAIQAMQIVHKQNPDAYLYIWGEGPEKTKLQDLVHTLGLEDVVVFKGFSDDIKSELAQSAFFIFTPHFGEGTSIALIEAMVLSLPCIVMDTPAMREVVLDQETGFVVPNEDIEALAEKISLLLNKPSLRKEMGEAARKRAQMHFDLQSNAKKLASWLHSLK